MFNSFSLKINLQQNQITLYNYRDDVQKFDLPAKKKTAKRWRGTLLVKFSKWRHEVWCVKLL